MLLEANAEPAMAVHFWSILCQQSIIDKRTNNISLISVLEEISISDPPHDKRIAIGGDMSLVVLWSRSNPEEPEKETACRVVLRSPENKILETSDDVSVNLGAHERIRTVFRRQHFPIVGPGIYQFVVQIKNEKRWKKVCSVPLKVTVNYT